MKTFTVNFNEMDATPSLARMETLLLFKDILEAMKAGNTADYDTNSEAGSDSSSSDSTSSKRRQAKAKPYGRRYKTRPIRGQNELIDGKLHACDKRDYWAYHKSDLRRHQLGHSKRIQITGLEEEKSEIETTETKATNVSPATRIAVSRRYKMRPRSQMAQDVLGRVYFCRRSPCGYWSYSKQCFKRHLVSCSHC